MQPVLLRLIIVALLALGSVRAQETPTELAAAPVSVPKPASGTSTSAAYVLTNTDRININIYQEEDLSKSSRIDSQGRINLALVGTVPVSGLTVADAQIAIERAYQEGRILRNPRVTITVEEYSSREVSIQGQVRSPGRYPLPVEAGMSIVELITRAGGFTDTAKGTAVRVTRILPDGTKQNFDIDVESLIKGRKSASVQDNALILEPGDIVFVPERFI